VQHEIVDVRSTPTGQTLGPVSEARLFVTANLRTYDATSTPAEYHSPREVAMEARTLSVLRRRVGAVKGARNSGVDQSRAAVPRLWLYRSLPLPRVISQRHAFVCSSLKILLLSAGSSMGLQLQAAGWLSPSHSATRQAGLTKPSPSTQMIASAEAPADVLSSAQLDTSTVAGWSGSRSTCNTCFREKRIPLAGRLAGSGIPAEVHAPLGLAIAHWPSTEGCGALVRGLGVERRAGTGRGLCRVVRRC
jgi:hypothetical protein